MTERARFRQADVTRALKGAVAAGFAAPRLIIHSDGTIELITGENSTELDADDEWADLR
jgi:hypothetical protein